MSILIKDMKKPNNCHECPLLYVTSICDGYKDCPIVNVPPHGRLIDADAFKELCLSATREAKPDFIRSEDWVKACAVTLSFCRDIDEAPTIIEAEKEET